MSPLPDDLVAQADPRHFFSDPEPDMTLEISFETAVFMANSMPKNDEVTKAFKRLIRAKYESSLGLDP